MPATTEERLFTWRSPDGSLFELGSIAPGQNRLKMTGQSAATLVIRQGHGSSWPQRMVLSIEDTLLSRRWQIELDPREAIKPHKIRVAAGKYKFLATAPHHRPLVGTFALGGSDLNLGMRVLVPNPVLRGVVRSTDGTSVPGALIIAEPTRSTARSDASGAFTLEFEKDWPKQLRVVYPGMTEKVIIVPKAERDTTLPPVFLSKGGQITVRITPPLDDAELGAQLRREDDHGQKTIMEEARAQGEQGTISFDDLDGGRYDVLVRGSQALQQISMVAEVEEGKATELQARILPMEVDFEVVRGAKPLPRAVVLVTNLEHRWSGTFTADSAGRYRTEMWQRGKYLFTVTIQKDGAPFGVVREVASSDGRITLRLPERAVTGVVFDQSTARPIRDARVQLDSQTGDGGGNSIGVVADGSGRFEFPFVSAGTHSVTAAADSFIASEPVTFQLTEADSGREVRLELRPGTERKVIVTNRSGVPLGDATIIQVIGSRLENTYRSEPTGAAIIHLSADPSILFTLPRDGSLAVTRISSPGKADQTLPIVVPEGSASLQLRAVDESGLGIPGIRFLMRVDGEVIPPDVAAYVAAAAGFASYTDKSGALLMQNMPPGFYEFWPLRTSAEMRDILATLTSVAPVQVAVKPGANQATLTFARRK